MDESNTPVPVKSVEVELVVPTPEEQRDIDAIKAWAERHRKLAKELGVCEDTLIELW